MQRFGVFIWVALILSASWLSLTVLDPGEGIVRRGYFLGSLFGHATLAAAWPVFGPGRMIVRLPLSIVWVLSLSAAIAINIAVRGGPNDAALTLGGCLFGQWILLLFPFAATAYGFGLQLRHTTEAESGADGRAFRFGIRDLLIVMAICSILLGLGRIIVPNLSVRFANELAIFLFLAVAAVVMTFPLLLAALLPRRTLLGVLLSLVLIAGATASEFPLMEMIGGMRGPEWGDFIAINIASAAFILLVAGVVRLNGYCLLAKHAPKEL